jgi:hypothetical protein
MKELLALLALLGAQTGLCQNPQLCKKTLLDPRFRPPAQIQVNQGPGIGERTVLPLFSENGMDFYGLDRKKAPSGQAIYENAAWILGVLADENLRQSAAQLLMQRIGNPNLDANYAAGLKFVLVDMEIADDRESEKYKTWLKCSSLTSSQKKCPYPAQVPTLFVVQYYQPQNCVLTDEARGLLFEDDLPGIARTYRQYQAPPIPPYLPSLLKAANLMMEKFNAEDEKRR